MATFEPSFGRQHLDLDEDVQEQASVPERTQRTGNASPSSARVLLGCTYTTHHCKRIVEMGSQLAQVVQSSCG